MYVCIFVYESPVLFIPLVVGMMISCILFHVYYGRKSIEQGSLCMTVTDGVKDIDRKPKFEQHEWLL